MFEQNHPILLASGSPRRHEYLHRFGLEFKVASAEIDETVQQGEPPREYLKRMVFAKATPFLSEVEKGVVVITADTLVWVGGEILGKPGSAAEVLPMLTKLNGQTHQVMTGFGVFFQSQTTLCEVTSAVTFRDNPTSLLEAYAKTDEPLDKAGSYSVQGLGTLLVEKIEGSYNNVVGLPVEELFSRLVQLGHLSPKV